MPVIKIPIEIFSFRSLMLNQKYSSYTNYIYSMKTTYSRILCKYFIHIRNDNGTLFKKLKNLFSLFFMNGYRVYRLWWLIGDEGDYYKYIPKRSKTKLSKKQLYYKLKYSKKVFLIIGGRIQKGGIGTYFFHCLFFKYYFFHKYSNNIQIQ